MNEPVLYCIITKNCNLNCKHCNIKKHTSNEIFNKDIFISKINKFNGRKILFGGEPLFYKRKFMEIMDQVNEIHSISTNLIRIDDYILEKIKEKNIYINTSWNLNRFNEKELELWYNNLNRLNELDLKCTVLITLDRDLVSNVLFESNIEKLIQLLKTWEKYYKAIEYVKFEQLLDLDATSEFYKSVDNFLVKLYKQIKEEKIHLETNLNFNRFNWKYYCNNVSTLLPDGNIINGCPDSEYISKQDLNENLHESCMYCKYLKYCKPCKLQKLCTFPKNLFDILNIKNI